MRQLEGKVAIVTGSAGGMGRSHALRLASLGADVVITDIDLEASRQFGEILGAATVMDEVRALGVRSIGISADLADRAQAARMIEQTMSAFGRIDILVNNAGGAVAPADRSTATKTPPEDTELLFAANFKTMLNCCQAAAPHLTRPGGTVVNISSIGVDRDDATGRFALYFASKAAVARYSQSLAVELGPEGIRVNCISPGLIETARIKSQAAARDLATKEQAKSVPLGRLGCPDDISNVLEFLVSRLSTYITGETIRVCGGATLSGLYG
jgi:3-oxoacyl-[acyl-carrier protein] reductase